METPTLSKAQKRSTLSAKKNKPKETIKNIVTTPFQNSYWPRISSQDHEELQIVLQHNLPLLLKPSKPKIPWTVLRTVPKSDRKKFRNEYGENAEVTVPINKEASEGLILGINKTTKLLENNLADVILIASDIQPLLVRHVIDLAVLYKVCVLIVDSLRETLCTLCGLRSVVMCIHKNITPESKLNMIKETVARISKKYPPPKNHINFKRSVDLSDPIEDIFKPEHLAPTEDKINSSEKLTESNEELEKKIYLKRETKTERAFVPENSLIYINVHKMEVDTTGFLPFTEMETKNTESNECNYSSLVVKKVKSDRNRTKRNRASIRSSLKHVNLIN